MMLTAALHKIAHMLCVCVCMHVCVCVCVQCIQASVTHPNAKVPYTGHKVFREFCPKKSNFTVSIFGRPYSDSKILCPLSAN